MEVRGNLRTGKGMIVALVVMFVAVIGMFVYNIAFSSAQESKQFETVLVAKDTILEGEAITKDDVKEIKIDKSAVVDSYVLNTKELGKDAAAKTTILANEILTDERISSEKKEMGNHSLDLSFSNNITVEEGDFVRILVKPKYMSQVFELFAVKEIEKLNYKVQSNGTQTGVLESITLNVTEEEMALYQQALSDGEIIVAKFDSVAEVEEEYITFEEALSTIERSVSEVREEGRKEGYFFVTLHKVEKEDTLQSLADKYKVSEEQIKKLNDSSDALVEDSIIRVN